MKSASRGRTAGARIPDSTGLGAGATCGREASLERTFGAQARRAQWALARTVAGTPNGLRGVARRADVRFDRTVLRDFSLKRALHLRTSATHDKLSVDLVHALPSSIRSSTGWLTVNYNNPLS